MKRAIALALFLAFQLAAPAWCADLAGQWRSSQHQIALSLEKDGSYTLAYPNGQTARGSWAAQSGVLALSDPATGGSILYSLLHVDDQTLRLADAYGAQLVFERQAPAAAQNRESPSDDPAQTHIRFVAFLVNQPLAEEDKNLLRKEAEAALARNPQQFMQEKAFLDQNMAQAYAMTDPVRIGLVRQALMANLFRERQGNPELGKSPPMKIIDRYSPVLAYDQPSGMVLTQNDVDGILDYVEFVQGLTQPGFHLPPENRKDMTNQIVASFPSVPLEQKKAYVSAGLLSEWLKKNWQAMDAQQRMQFATGYAPAGSMAGAGQGGDAFAQGVAMGRQAGADVGRQAASYQGGCPQCLNIMSNMNTQSHATALNIIENIGGTGNYWEVKPSWQTW